LEIPWVIEEQTKVKHELLKRYIRPWMAILYSTQKKFNLLEVLLYFDGFSGPGIYYEDEKKETTCLGSPLIVAEAANDYTEAESKRKLNMFLIDKDSKCVEILRKHINEMNKFNQDWIVFNAEFEQKIHEILNELDKKRLSTQPMFFFIDPFGYSGFPIKTLERILKYPRAELFINFMIYDIARFCEEQQFEAKLNELYGNNEYKNVSKCSTPETRQAYLLNLYCKSLKEIAKAEFVMPFRVNTPDKGTRPRYYLIHASKNLKALKVMKDNMGKVSDNEYRFEAIGIATKQMSLFEDPGKIELIERIKGYCATRITDKIAYEEIEDWAYTNTDGVSKTIKESLLILEINNIIKIERQPRQQKSTVTKGAKINYIGGKQI
jgi:three-Cys-motif partner protein